MSQAQPALFKTAWNFSLRSWPEILKNSFGILATLHLSAFFIAQLVLAWQKNAQIFASENIGALVAIFMLQFVAEILLGSAFTLVIAFALFKPLADTKTAYKQLLIEQVRSIARVMQWAPLILPAIYYFLKFIFLPYYVLLSPAYWRGEREALSATGRLSKHRSGFLIGINLFALTIPGLVLLAIRSSGEYILTHPIPAITACIISFFFSLFFQIFLFSITDGLIRLNSEI